MEIYPDLTVINKHYIKSTANPGKLI